MTLIVETGTGASDSESFASVADADLYFSNRGNATWAALTTTVKEQLLRKSTDYLEQTYRLKWSGFIKTTTQALSWPREEVERKDYTLLNQLSYYANDIVPVEVRNACVELALKANSGELSPDIEQRVTKEKIDVIEVTYSEYSPQYTTYRSIENMLLPFLDGYGGSFRKIIRT